MVVLGQKKEYWINAAKQFIWPLDFKELQILVPEPDLELAGNNLMVSHFRNAGWHVQSVMKVEYTKPFIAPESNGVPIFRPIVKPEEAKQESEFKVGDKFRIMSTGCELRLTHIESDKVHLEYTNRDKHGIINDMPNLQKVLKMEVWERII